MERNQGSIWIHSLGLCWCLWDGITEKKGDGEVGQQHPELRETTPDLLRSTDPGWFHSLSP